MTAVSRKTAEDTLRVLAKYVQIGKLEELIDELMTIPGNKAFRDTVTLMRHIFDEYQK